MPTAASGASPTGTRLLRLLATTDLHMQILAHDYVTDRPTPHLGLVRAAAAIARLRAGPDACLLFDNGDFLQGNALGDLALAETEADGRIHPMIAAFNLAGCDAVTIGNHDMDHGLGALGAALGHARFAAVSANLRPSDGAPAICRPWTILSRQLGGGALRIGVTGALPPQSMRWNHHHLAGRVEIGAIRPAIEDAVGRMRAAGADLIVVLCHSGIGPVDGATDERISAEIARMPGVNAVFAGHTHEVAADDGAPGAPIVQAGARGSHLGCIDLNLEPAGAAGWRVLGATARAIALGDGLAGAAPDPQAGAAAAPRIGQSRRIRALVAAQHARVRQAGSARLGWCEGRLHSHAAALAPPPTVRLIARLQVEAVAAALRGGPCADLPILAAAAPLRAGDGSPGNPVTDIPPGPFLRRHLDDICPYADTIAARVITGAELRAWLVQAAGIFAQAAPDETDADGHPPTLLRADRPLQGFDTILGLDYAIALDGVPRIRDLRHAGRPVAADDRFVLAASSYRLHGGGGYPLPPHGSILMQGPGTLRGALERHLAERGSIAIDPDPPRIWRLEAAAGTRRTLILPTAARRILPPGADPVRAGGRLRVTVTF